MPIPELTGDMKTEDAIAKYAEYGWSKRLQFEWIEVNQRTGQIIKKTFDVNSDAMPCSYSDDASYQLTFVQFAPSGIQWTCGMCRNTQGPLAFEAAGFRLIEEKQVTLMDAWNTLKKTKQRPPIGMPPLSSRAGLRIR
jgi:hypothetical protein